MSILVVSVSHQTAPMDYLSRLTLDGSQITKMVHALVDSDHVDEAVVVSTCNRTEVYAAVSRFHGGLAALTQVLGDVTGEPVEGLQDNCAVFYDEAAVSHCFMMTSGLDSMVAGEHQILGQVKQALTHCQQDGTVGSVLNALFQQALRVAKRVHSETAAGSAGRSLVTAALQQLHAVGVDVAGRRVVVVGAGSMAALAAHTVAAAGAEVTCVNRTFERAERLAAAVHGSARPLAELDETLVEQEVLITCTGARGLRIGPESLVGTKIRGVIDLALPADVCPEVGDLLDVHLVSLETLAQAVHGEQGSVRDGLSLGPGLREAEQLVLSEVKDFLGLRRAAQVAPTVVALRTMATEVMNAELSRLEGRLPDLDDHERDEIAQTVRRVVEKLLHQPTVRVKELVAMPDSPDYAAALRELFALDTQAIDALSQPR